jgi:uncharacterized protein
MRSEIMGLIERVRRADNGLFSKLSSCLTTRPVNVVLAVALFPIGAQAQVDVLKAIPGKLQWKNPPASYHIESGSELSVRAGAQTDWFNDPFGGRTVSSAPILLFKPASDYVLTTKVRIEFKNKWDAGALMVWADGTHWAKLLLEMSAEGHPNIVSVVTRGLSDDCNSVLIPGDSVFLRIAKSGQAYVFYSSTDGKIWHIIRSFNLETNGSADHVGFLAQSPEGVGALVVFSEIDYKPTKIPNIYNWKNPPTPKQQPGK